MASFKHHSVVIHFTGIPPADLSLLPAEFIELSPETPPFKVDALLVFSDGDPDDAHVKTLRRSGRPILRIAPSEGSANAPAAAPEKDAELKDWIARLSETPRTNYEPIDCNFYDNFEAAIVQRRKVELEYRTADDSTVIDNILLKDLKTDRTEEYVQLENKEWLRLDRIISVDGEAAGASCRF